ncbi:MAG: TIGR01459 family HAD-type hydrolase [Rickettsiales bacterium]|nr:TIGR01459 family HAD-type hydrolase [Rickettsiales bacterium]
MRKPLEHLDGLSPILDQYDGFLLDLWGVVHDGETLYPGVADALKAMHKAGKRIVFLSNAPRRARIAQARLAELGIAEEIIASVVTSGEAAYRFLSTQPHGWTRYAFCGPQRDRGLLEGLPLMPSAIEQADFLLNVGFTDDNEPVSEWMPMLNEAHARRLPMLCANPDRIVVRLNGEVLPCAGLLADAYLSLGGRVQYFGKPHADVYTLCESYLQGIPKARLLAIGDSLETDILGANRAVIDSALVMGGILKGEIVDVENGTLKIGALMQLCDDAQAFPRYTLPGLSL